MNLGRFRQFHTALASGFGSFTMSLLNSWTSYTSDVYFSNTTPMSTAMTKAEEALLGSLPSLGAMLGVAITGVLINNLGRRNGGVVLYLPMLISWVIVSLTTSIKLVLAARFFGGISGGASLVLAPIFASEVAEDSIRGTLASSSMFLYCAGILVSYSMGFCLTYRTIIWINLVVSTTGIILLILVTESPIYFLRQKKEEDAKLSIAKYRGAPVSSILVLDELTKLKQQMMPSMELVSMTVAVETDPKSEDPEKEKLRVEETETVKPQSLSTIKLLFLEPASRKAFFIVTAIVSMQVFMGNVPVQVYAKSVFTQTDPSKADLYTIIFAVVLFTGAALSAVLNDRAGRRILLISSSVLVFVCMTTLGFLLQTKQAPPMVSVIVIFIYCFCFTSGAGTIPYVLLAEVFIPEVQNLASMIIVELVWLLNFLILAIFPYMNILFGIHGSFYIFGVMGITNAIFAYFLVPETKGLSNAQIQDLFMIRKRN